MSNKHILLLSRCFELIRPVGVFHGFCGAFFYAVHFHVCDSAASPAPASELTAQKKEPPEGGSYTSSFIVMCFAVVTLAAMEPLVIISVLMLEISNKQFKSSDPMSLILYIIAFFVVIKPSDNSKHSQSINSTPLQIIYSNVWCNIACNLYNLIFNRSLVFDAPIMMRKFLDEGG